MALPTPGPNDVWGADLNAEINSKAYQADVDAALAGKADAADLAAKADQATVDADLATKADITYVDSGLAGKADTAYVDSAVAGKADQSALDAVSAQQDQLMTTAATVDDLLCTIQVSAVPDGAGGTTLTANSLIITGLVAPFPLKILSCSYTREYVDIAASGTNYLNIALQRAGADGVLIAQMAAKDTSQEALTARKPWTFDGVVWNETHRVLQTHEVLRISMDAYGTAEVRCPMHFTVRYQPL